MAAPVMELQKVLEPVLTPTPFFEHEGLTSGSQQFLHSRVFKAYCHL